MISIEMPRAIGADVRRFGRRIRAALVSIIIATAVTILVFVALVIGFAFP
jgi:hypothetical protein